MSVLKYKDPTTGAFKVSRTVKVVGDGGGGESAPAVTAEQLTASAYPDYVQPEVIDIVRRVNTVREDSSIVFVAMSDSHYVADQKLNFYDAETNASTVQANQAAKVLSYLIQPDFFAHLGDVSCGHGTTTPEMLKSQIEGFINYFREAKSDLPVFVAIGNHDTGIYYHDEQTDGGIHTMTGDYLYQTFTAHSASADTVFGGEENGGYCYRDFADKKLRVILLNTSEKLVAVQKDQATYGAQRVWLANALLDLNAKADAVDWGFVILSHYPADYGNTKSLSDLLAAYVNGESFTITDPVTSYYVGDETNQTVDFSGKNGAKFIAQFHGHIHNFKTDKLYSGGAQYDGHRICIPNGQYNRENTYGTVGGVNFAEDQAYLKTAGTADGTSFVVNVINPTEEKIYSFCYGAGYDRVIGFGATVYHSVALRLSHVTSSNDALSVETGTAYTATLTPEDGYQIKSVSVTMDGADITSTAYNNGTVSIAKVTGNVVITAKAQQRPNFTNLVPLSINADGTDFFVDGDGYDNGAYVNSSGVTGTLKSGTATGYISVPAGVKTIRIAGEGLSIDPIYTRIAFFDANFKLIYNLSYKNMGILHSTGVYYNGQLIKEDSTLLTFKVTANTNGRNGVYMRVCTIGDGAELVVTVDEKITYG